jgi:DNA gyrase subunit A
MKLASGDRLIAFKAARDDSDAIVVRTSMGGEQRVGPSKYEVTTRGGRGREVLKRGTLVAEVHEIPAAPPPFDGAE